MSLILGLIISSGYNIFKYSIFPLICLFFLVHLLTNLQIGNNIRCSHGYSVRDRTGYLDTWVKNKKKGVLNN